MNNCLERKEALKRAKSMAKECLSLLEKTAFLFHPYKDDEKKISNVYIEHLKAMARKVVESFDQKSDQIQDFVIVYEAIKALMVAIDEATKKLSNGKNLVLV